MYTFGTGDNMRSEWRSHGKQVGWVDEAKDDLYLLPEAAYNVAQQVGESTGAGLSVTQQTLLKRMKQHDYLKSVDGPRNTNTVRRMLSSAQHKVVHIRADMLIGRDTDNSDIPDFDHLPRHSSEHATPSNGNSLMSGFPSADPEPANHNWLEPRSMPAPEQSAVANVGFVENVEHIYVDDSSMTSTPGSALGSDGNVNAKSLDNGQWRSIPSDEPVHGAGDYRFTRAGGHQPWVPAVTPGLEGGDVPWPDDPSGGTVDDPRNGPNE